MASWSEKLNQMTQNAISKSKEVAGVTKLNLEISTLNQNIKNVQTEVGAYVLENGLLLEDASVAEWAAKVASLKAEVEANTEKIHDLKNVSICPGCGAEVSRTSKFCDKCGTALVIRVSEPTEPDEVVVDASYSDAESLDVSEAKAEEAYGAKAESFEAKIEAYGAKTDAFEAKAEEVAAKAEALAAKAEEAAAAEAAETKTENGFGSCGV